MPIENTENDWEKKQYYQEVEKDLNSTFLIKTAQQHMKKSTSSKIIRKTQIKRSIRYHLIAEKINCTRPETTYTESM